MADEITKTEYNTPAVSVTNNFTNAEHGVQIANVENLNISTEQTIDILESILAAIPRPTMVPPPPDPAEEESNYIKELCRAYADRDGLESYDVTDLSQDDQEDLSDRRIDYFAAESIRRSASELTQPSLQGQFYVLKDEMKESVKDIPKLPHANGYECMLDVMTQAANAPIEEYLLKNAPGWISKKIKKGICHFLVNEGKLKWVKK